MRTRVMGIAACVALLSGGAMAQGYIGGGIGQGHISDDCTGASSCSLNSTGGKLFGGYRFDNGLAVEANYFEFGKAKATISGVNLSFKGNAFGLGGAYFGKFSNEWVGVARLGMASVRAEGNGSAGGSSASVSETSTKAYGGLGLGYMVSKNVSLDLAWDFSRASLQGATDNVRLISIGVTASF